MESVDNVRFEDDLLSKLLIQEKKQRTMPLLMSCLEGKKLFATDLAVEECTAIVNVIGGPKERQRLKVCDLSLSLSVSLSVAFSLSLSVPLSVSLSLCLSLSLFLSLCWVVVFVVWRSTRRL
jgi:hypothetical protein